MDKASILGLEPINHWKNKDGPGHLYQKLDICIFHFNFKTKEKWEVRTEKHFDRSLRKAKFLRISKFQFQFLCSHENGFLKPHHAFRRRNLRLRRSTSTTTWTWLCLCLRSNSPSNSVSSPNSLSLSPIHCLRVFFFSLNFNGFWCRSSSQKYSPLDWSAYFDREDDIRIKDTENVSLSVSNWSTFYSNRKSLFFVCVFL